VERLERGETGQRVKTADELQVFAFVGDYVASSVMPRYPE
jgi:hypothetical protein